LFIGLVTFLQENRSYTIDELAEFNGKNGKPAYIAFKGKVYDITDSSLWADGEHLGHLAGEDLTMAIEIAPHGDEAIMKMKVVGTLSPP
jgi:predicted heme/steroid binding protein